MSEMEVLDVRVTDGIGYYRARRAMRALRAEAEELQEDLLDYIYRYVISEDFGWHVKRLASAVCDALGIDEDSDVCNEIKLRLWDYVSISVDVKVEVDLNIEKLRELINEALQEAGGEM